MSAIFFWLIFDQKRLCFPIVQKSFLGPYRLQKSSKIFFDRKPTEKYMADIVFDSKNFDMGFQKKINR
jgi:hypothetical protein